MRMVWEMPKIGSSVIKGKGVTHCALQAGRVAALTQVDDDFGHRFSLLRSGASTPTQEKQKQVLVALLLSHPILILPDNLFF